MGVNKQETTGLHSLINTSISQESKKSRSKLNVPRRCRIRHSRCSLDSLIGIADARDWFRTARQFSAATDSRRGSGASFSAMPYTSFAGILTFRLARIQLERRFEYFYGPRFLMPGIRAPCQLALVGSGNWKCGFMITFAQS